MVVFEKIITILELCTCQREGAVLVGPSAIRGGSRFPLLRISFWPSFRVGTDEAGVSCFSVATTSAFPWLFGANATALDE